MDERLQAAAERERKDKDHIAKLKVFSKKNSKKKITIWRGKKINVERKDTDHIAKLKVFSKSNSLKKQLQFDGKKK